MTQNNFFYNLNKRLDAVTGESHQRARETEIANEAAMSTVESVFAKMNSQPSGHVVREADSDKLAALRDKLPFEPDAEAPSHKDEFGNEIKHMARHLARMGMHDAEKSLEKDGDVEEGIIGQAAGTLAGSALGGPVGAAIGGALGNKLTDEDGVEEGILGRAKDAAKKWLDDAPKRNAARDQESDDIFSRDVTDPFKVQTPLNQMDFMGGGLDEEQLDEMFGFGKEDNSLLDYFISLFTPGGKRDAKATPEQVEKAFKAADREFGPLEQDISSENVVAGYLSELFGLKPSYSMAEEKAEKDFDKDGEIESPKAEYMGSRDRVIKAAMKKPKTIKESMDDADFIDYVFSFYGPNGIYDMGASKDQIADALDMYRSKEDTDFAADSVDRENIRDIMIDKMGLKFPEGGIKMGDIHLDESDLGDSLSDAARELAMFADNDAQLHRSSEMPIRANLEKKAKKGVYDSELAKKLWKYHADRAAQSYAQQHGDGQPWQRMFTPDDRRQAAAYWEEAFREELMANGILDEQFILEKGDDYWDFKDLKDEPTSRTRTVAGTRYGGSAQVDDEEDDDEESSAPKKRGRPAGTAKKTGARRPGVYEEGVSEAGYDIMVKHPQYGSEWEHATKMDGKKKHTYSSKERANAVAKNLMKGSSSEYAVAKSVKDQGVSEGNYHDADFVNKSERLERLRAMAKRQGDREAFDKYNSEIKKLYNADVTTPDSTFDESFDAEINPAKKGMFAGKDKAELQKQYNRLKASGPHKLGSPESTKMKELAFAIRAKSGWGKVNK